MGMLVTVNEAKYEAYQRARTALYAMTKDTATHPVELAEQRLVVLTMHHELFYMPGPHAGTEGTIETPHPLG
jgi:hypothetical protein